MAAQQQQQQWGITPHVSTTLPTEQELKLNQDLMNELKRQKNFETPEGSEKRKAVLAHFETVAKQFIKDIAKARGLSEGVQNDSGGMISTFGSYRLGAYNPDSDIDTLLVAPKHVKREDFLAHFPSTLKRMSPEGAIDECIVVHEAFVPIINYVYQGVKVDLIFVALKQDSVGKGTDLTDNNLLRGLDETDLRSINGVRVTDEILTLVPQQKAFKMALRAIKLWANRRAIYSNISGFPGGVAWAMMVARVCQLYPMATSGVIVNKTMDILARWKWPQPIQLKKYEKGPLEVREWNPTLYPGDRRHIMPVITPAYPSMCATNNITPSTREIIRKELVRGAEICSDISDGKKTWASLFTKHTFFTQDFKYYLSVVALSRSEPAHQIWAGLVHSKVRRLVQAIEDLTDSGVAIARPYVEGIEREHKCKTEEDVDSILHGDTKFQVKLTDAEKKARQVNIAAMSKETPPRDPKDVAEIDGETRTIYTTTYYIGLELATTSDNKTRLDISFPVSELRRMCVDWEDFNLDMMSVCTVHTRSYDLPDDVFTEGEKKPEKPKKKKNAARTNGSATPLSEAVPKKRALDAEGAEISKAKRAMVTTAAG